MSATTRADTRRRCLDLARRHVTTDRNTTHGEPEDSFAATADLWSALGLRKITADGTPALLTAPDVALALALLTGARLRHNPAHDDSWIDLAGYAACGMDVAQPTAT